MTVWLITGCSSGFGEEITLAALKKKGDIVLATCRNDVSRISKLKEAGAITLELDINAPVEVINSFVKDVLEIPEVKSRGGVDVLVNNAGYLALGALEDYSMEELKASFDTNFFGHVALTKALLPEFRSRRSGTIAFIGSYVGYMKYPASILYSAAKYAIAGLAECLAAEVETFNIRVTCIEPSEFRTELLKGPNVKKPKNGEIEDYKTTAVETTRQFYVPTYAQPGDTAKGSQRIVDLLRGDWPGAEIGSGSKIPVRLALGDHAYKNLEEVYASRLEKNKEWRDWICGCNYE